ncbi:uncharacterized protein LOC142344917 [Convolutriloba macropyga]|uniref:uncharacterized protein LOC142344917 n=1 Tax=Convolutriloba macropyga TaxID=536237 RepID=UPI003F527C34
MTSLLLEHPYVTSASVQSSKFSPPNMPTSPTACLPLTDQPSTSTGIYHPSIYHQQVPKSEAKQYPSTSIYSSTSRSNFASPTYQPIYSTTTDPINNVQELSGSNEIRDPIRESVEQLFKFAEEEANSSSGGGSSPFKSCPRPSVLELDSTPCETATGSETTTNKNISLNVSSPSQSSEAKQSQKQKQKPETREYYTPSSQKPHPKAKSYRYSYTSRPSSTIITSHTPSDLSSGKRSSSGSRPRSYTASSSASGAQKQGSDVKDNQSTKSSSHSRQHSNGGGVGGYTSNGSNGGTHKKKGSNSYDTASLSSCGSNQSRNSDYSFLACEGKGEFVVEKESKTLVLATTARSLTPPDDLKSNVQGYERTEGKTVVKTVKKLSIKKIQSQPPSSLTSPVSSAFLTP